MLLRLRELRRSSAARSLLAALVLGLVAFGAAACGDDDDAGEVVGTVTDTADTTDASGATGEGAYRATLDPLNDSGVTGEATVEMADGALTVAVRAEGLVPGTTHPQHIHQTAEAGPGSCPTPGLDADGDGVITLDEGAPAYGPVALPLEPFPTAPGGTLEFSQTYETVPDETMPLDEGVIVVHGGTRDGEYVPTLPVACGAIG